MPHSDLSEAFPDGEIAQHFKSNDWLTAMARETRANKDFSQRTQDTARWAREQIKRQSGEINTPFSVKPSKSKIVKFHIPSAPMTWM